MAVKLLTYEEWLKMIDLAETSTAELPPIVPNGFSPGGAAAELGISRQAVHQAMREGRLGAYRIPAPGGKGSLYLIPQEALDDFQARRGGGGLKSS